jgi:hypothetical protein
MIPRRTSWVVVCLIGCFVGGCKEAKSDAAPAGESAVGKEAPALSSAPLPASTLPTNERDRLIPLAQKVLGFVRNKDTEALVLMAAPAARPEMTRSLQAGEAMHQKLFAADGWSWKAVDGWDDEIDDVRVKGDEARAKYSEIDGKRAAVVMFRKVDGVWHFEGMDDPTVEAYGSWGEPAR